MRVYGGLTNAGTRKPLKEQAQSWQCTNGHYNKGYWARCMTASCNERRP